MTLDHLREIALIQISQAQRTNAMTAIKIKFLKPGYRISVGPNGNVSIKVDRLSTFYSLDIAKQLGIIA